jgi:hypothetical protein
MEPKPGREATLALRDEIIPTRPDGLTPFLCLDCRRQLDVHQPDADLPDRMRRRGVAFRLDPAPCSRASTGVAASRREMK